ncbi:hypothetical protein RJ639_010469 [Escallonia herrerae]|uniref:Uncharacterized protein n=1 Tax=Escallonia herrerae TaxID=1293975 RepID=A0AA88VVG4_9ASTE|nr:hypothetical protein RJ639_010469 [Escallonia herrerae]
MEKPRSRRCRVRIHRLNRSKRNEPEERGKDMEMELRNLKLYVENIGILEANEKLRKKASLLHQENLALLSEFEKKFPLHHPSSASS